MSGRIDELSVLLDTLDIAARDLQAAIAWGVDTEGHYASVALAKENIINFFAGSEPAPGKVQP